MVTHVPVGRSVVRPESVSQLVANVLRQRIVRGDLAEGSSLPRLDDLTQEFHVSRPSLREALRILETEGLVSVKRGKTGGSVVHRPSAMGAAPALGFILESQQATLSDLADSLRLTLPVCAALCAATVSAAVVAELDELIAESLRLVDDEVASVAVSRRFHERIVANCGNRTLIVVFGSLEALWTAHQNQWASRDATRFDGERRRQGIEEHIEIVDAIRSGDPERTGQIMRDHLAHYGYNVPASVGGASLVRHLPPRA